MSIRPTVKSDPELVLRIKALNLHRDQTPFFQKPRGPQENCKWNSRNSNRDSQGFNQQGQRGQAFRPRTNRRPQTPPAPKTQDSMGLESKVEAWNRSEKAWKPRKTFQTSSNPLQSKAKEIRGLLNKITPTTFGELTEKFLAENVFKNGQLLPLVVDNIFDKAVEEPSYCPLYSDLVACQVQEESVNRSKHFLISVLSRCQKTFEAESRIAFKEKLEGLKKEIQDADDEKTKKLLQENIAKAQLKERRRVMGNIGLIAQLYRNKLVSLKILNLCIATLLKTHEESRKSDEESLECAIKLI
ncbi:hypothetical protein L596_030139 [Steinernema carpocapsae]|uniref:MIF4G domain-containing protein n=1 Tax=Steinernema carpocapsae TaxID=34508 RepID=A0A4U5LRU3_STECR|nr:hypothetical protein L596_030139 [Steinernema carpocapsae]